MFATMHKTASGTRVPRSTLTIEERRLRHDRWIAVAVIALFAVMMGLLLLFANWSGPMGPNYEYWMLP
jgi:hypothetical protein